MVYAFIHSVWLNICLRVTLCEVDKKEVKKGWKFDLTKGYMLWYNNKAVGRKRESKGNKWEKNGKRFGFTNCLLDKFLKMWYNKRVVTENEEMKISEWKSETAKMVSWKLNNALQANKPLKFVPNKFDTNLWDCRGETETKSAGYLKEI